MCVSDIRVISAKVGLLFQIKAYEIICQDDFMCVCVFSFLSDNQSQSSKCFVTYSDRISLSSSLRLEFLSFLC